MARQKHSFTRSELFKHWIAQDVDYGYWRGTDTTYAFNGNKLYEYRTDDLCNIAIDQWWQSDRQIGFFHIGSNTSTVYAFTPYNIYSKLPYSVRTFHFEQQDIAASIENAVSPHFHALHCDWDFYGMISSIVSKYKLAQQMFKDGIDYTTMPNNNASSKAYYLFSAVKADKLDIRSMIRRFYPSGRNLDDDLSRIAQKSRTTVEDFWQQATTKHSSAINLVQPSPYAAIWQKII